MAGDSYRRASAIALRTFHQLRADRATLMSSAVAFRMTLAIFPAIAILAWLAGRIVEPEQVRQAFDDLAGVVPDSARRVVEGALTSSFQHGPGERGRTVGALAFAAPVLGLAFTLWSANSGTRALFGALNVIYDKEERRGFWRFTALTLVFTVGFLVGLAAVAALLILGSTLLASEGVGASWIGWLRWPLIFALGAAGLSVLNRHAPNREREHWPWFTVGSLGASLLLLVSSALFSWATETFVSLSLTYGSVSSIAAFMLWLWLSFTIVLAGAELDACIERERTGENRRGDRKDKDVPP